jgi:hypothetical protein
VGVHIGAGKIEINGENTSANIDLAITADIIDILER